MKPLFILNTGGRCFLCLNTIPPKSPSLYVDKHQQQHISQEEDNLYHFPNLWEYFKILYSTMGKAQPPDNSATSVTDSDPPPLWNLYDLKGTMCWECALFSQSFDLLLDNLKDIKMKLKSRLKSIYDKMTPTNSVNGEEVCQTFKKEMMGRTETSQYFGMVEQLRKETVKQCSTVFNIAPGSEPKPNHPRPNPEKVLIFPKTNDAIQVQDIVQFSVGNPNTNCSLANSDKARFRSTDNVCHMCFKQFQSRCLLSDHIQVFHYGKPLYCRICQKAKYLSRSGRNSHERGCHVKQKSADNNKRKEPDVPQRYPILPSSLLSPSTASGLEGPQDNITNESHVMSTSFPGEHRTGTMIGYCNGEIFTGLTRCKFCSMVVSDLSSHLYYAHSKFPVELNGQVQLEKDVHNQILMGPDQKQNGASGLNNIIPIPTVDERQDGVDEGIHETTNVMDQDLSSRTVKRFKANDTISLASSSSLSSNIIAINKELSRLPPQPESELEYNFVDPMIEIGDVKYACPDMN